MARLQILELPEGAGDDRPPFVLVVDEYEPRRYIMGPDQNQQPTDEFDGIAEKVGARCILVFADTVDIPANDTTAYLDASGQSRTRSDELRAQIQEEIAKAQAELTDVLNRQDAR